MRLTPSDPVSCQGIAVALFAVLSLPAAAQEGVPKEPGVVRVAPPELQKMLRGAETQAPVRIVPEKSTVVFVDDDFENGVQSSTWRTYDGDPRSGSVYWGPSSERSQSGDRSAWCAGRGGSGKFYANDMEAWMIAGPFDFSDADGGTVSWSEWLSTERLFDFFWVLHSTDGVNFEGERDSGSGAWFDDSMSLFRVAGRPRVWIAFLFESDFSNVYEGVYVDDVVISKRVPDPEPDLDLELVDAASGSYLPGDPIEIRTRIKNIGTAAANSYRIVYYASEDKTITVSDGLIGAVERGRLNVNAVDEMTVTLPFPGSVPEGDYYVGARLTVLDAIFSNNVNYDPEKVSVSFRRGFCEPSDELSCSSPIQSGNNAAPGSTLAIDEWDCQLEGEISSSREYAYEWTAPASGRVAAQVRGYEGDLDVIVLQGSAGCGPTSCVPAFLRTNTPGTEAISWDAQAGATYFIVVDGFNGVESDYELELYCEAVFPVAGYTYAPRRLTVGEPVTFTDRSFGDVIAWQWDFGDGSESEERHPTHVFRESGVYDVTLTVYNAFGSSSFGGSYIVDDPEPLEAAFTLSPTGPRTGERVQFGDASAGTPVAWLWDFGDGTQSTARNPRHAYKAAGLYPLRFGVADVAGAVSVVEGVVAVDEPGSGIEIQSPSTARAGQRRLFETEATGCEPLANGWRWEIAGADLDRYSDPSKHSIWIEWKDPGTKVVTVSNVACGNAVGRKTITVTPLTATPPPLSTAPEIQTALVLGPGRVYLDWRYALLWSGTYVVQASVEYGPFEDVALAPNSNRSTVIEGLPDGKDLRLRIRARDLDQLSPPSNVVAVTTPAGAAAQEAGCVASAANLCLSAGRFHVRVEWRDPRGNSGVGSAVALTSDTGYFWFFSESNIELIVKLLDGRNVNGNFWVFYGALSSVEYTITVTDTETGAVKTYQNPQGNLGSRSDVEAFDGLRTPTLPPAAAWTASALDREAFPGVAVKAGEVDFTVSPHPIGVGVPVRFADSQPAGTYRFWDFGDFNERSTTSSQVDHVYTEPGEYLVTFWAMGQDGDLRGSATVTHRVQVLADYEPPSKIDVTGATHSAADRPVTFVALADGCAPDPQGWSWSVDGGRVVGSGKGSLVDVRWSDAGTKTVTAGNSGCAAEGTHEIEIVPADDPSQPADGCAFNSTVLCLNQGRFRVELEWSSPTGAGRGQAVPFTDDTGFFWFFGPKNVEIAVKVLDGRKLNGHYWVFYGALSTVEYTITVTDTATGAVKRYRNKAGNIASFADTSAFASE